MVDEGSRGGREGVHHVLPPLELGGGRSGPAHRSHEPLEPRCVHELHEAVLRLRHDVRVTHDQDGGDDDEEGWRRRITMMQKKAMGDE